MNGMVTMMTPTNKAPSNTDKMRQLSRAFAAMLAEVLHRGFHGNAEVELKLQDGIIQHIVVRTERTIK